MIYSFLGPESTGKTTTIHRVATALNGIVVPEMSRIYLESIGLNYTYQDILNIAELQHKTEGHILSHNQDKIILCDTELITIQIWLEYYDYEVPSWIIQSIKESNYIQYFLFDTDVAWQKDSLRNNESDRDQILELFKNKLDFYHKPWALIQGHGEDRINNVLKFIEN